MLTRLNEVESNLGNLASSRHSGRREKTKTARREEAFSSRAFSIFFSARCTPSNERLSGRGCGLLGH